MIILRDYTNQREEIVPLLPFMFGIIAPNMRAIAPTGNSVERDYIIWKKAMEKDLENPQKHWVMVFAGQEMRLLGYALYRIAMPVLHMDEIQVVKTHQGDGIVFPALMGKILHDAEHFGTCTLRSYANKRNEKAFGILRTMGLQILDETETGYRYEGYLDHALAWFRWKYHNNQEQ